MFFFQFSIIFWFFGSFVKNHICHTGVPRRECRKIISKQPPSGFFGVLLTGSDAPHKLGDRSGCPKMPRGRPPRRAPRPLSAPSPPHHDPHPRAQGRPVSEYGNEQRGSYPFEGPVDEVRNKKKNRNVLLPETSIKSSPLIGRIRKIIIMKRSRLNDI